MSKEQVIKLTEYTDYTTINVARETNVSKMPTEQPCRVGNTSLLLAMITWKMTDHTEEIRVKSECAQIL